MDLCCVGGSALDVVLRVPSLPVSGEKLIAQFAGRMAGGVVSNTACAAARLGLNTGWSGQIGDDDNGRIVLNEFAVFGVDDSLITLRKDSPADFCVVLLEPSGERTILVVPTLPGLPPLTPGLLKALSQSRIAYTLPYTADIRFYRRNCAYMGAGEGLIVF